MFNDELTLEERAKLLGLSDAYRHGDYDKEFYKLLLSQDTLKLEDLDTQIRRALLKYVCELTESLLDRKYVQDFNLRDAIRTTLLLGLIQGYEIGRKLLRPLTAKPVHQ